MRLWILALTFVTFSLAGERAPMVANFQDSAPYRWLNKPVLDSRLLDNMESLTNWSTFTNGAPGVVDARVVATVSQASRNVSEMTLTRERSRDGRQSLRLRMPTKLDGPGPVNGRGWGSAGVKRRFEGEDWRKFNRISLWIYSDCPLAYVVSLGLRLSNDGVEKLPAPFGQEGEHSIVLRNQEWNHVVWEIGNVARDKVTELSISRGMSGNEPEAPDFAAFNFDHLELQLVDPDYLEGWGVWPGRISFSHAGYQSGATKSAIASGLNARQFSLVDQVTGQPVLTKPIATVTTHLGSFQVMDFSEVRQTGSYVLEAGGTATRPFRIDPNVWRQTIFKALNFFYAERCGFAIPGVHGVCHRDWTSVHGDKRIVINGGWHDAGDLTQGLTNSGEIVYGMFALAERLKARGEDPELYDRLLEEAKWGLDWVLKTSFGDGFRNSGSVNSRKTNGILGDFDDVTATARNYPMMNFVASAAEAIAHRVLKESDPRLAAYSLKMAEADWRFAVAGMADPTKPWTGATSFQDLWRVTFDSENVLHEAAATGTLASLDLWRATGEQRYADKAVELARIILDSQQRTRPKWDIPFTGFFYTSPAKDRLLHYVHRGREQGPALAFTQLCETFPNHPDWMKWYSVVVLHSQYLKAMAKYTEPYGVLPASIYKDDEYLKVPETRRGSFRQQVLNGIPLGAGHYLRLLPVWMDYRGHFGTVLAQTQALINAAHLRGDLDAAQLSQQQLEWVIGRNPFAQSTMWGEGYDFAPLDTPSSGDMVGALPVGIQTRGVNDVPYWPVQNTWTYKEVWVHPVGRWIWLMRDLAGPALVEGQADSTVEFRETTSGQRTEVKPDIATLHFRIMLPEGKYTVRCGVEERTKTFLPGATHSLDLRHGKALDFEVSKETSAAGEVTVKVSAQGNGSHRFALRADNLTVSGAEREVTLRSGVAGTLEWRTRIASADTLWVAVVIPDDDLSQRKEVTGAVWEH
jgi:Glycosyl hydrolase family 9/Cellulase N-terminal ig-like domain